MIESIKVSILCTVYNHEKFLRKCLDGFLMQKTNFKFEIIINDDASTDNSKEILEEYEKKYPDIIKVIYQKENQYSKGRYAFFDYLLPNAKGKYLAICEGDDCWIDENKLQKQYNIMEKNKMYSLCVHNTIIHDLLNREEDRLFNNWSNNYILKEEDVFFGWNVHTSSYFFDKEVFAQAENFKDVWCGDYVFLTIAFLYGKIIYINDVMSQYNYNNKEGVTYKNCSKSIKNIIAKANERKKYLEEFNKFSNYKFDEIINKRISEIELGNLFKETEFINNKKQFIIIKENILKNRYLDEYFKKMSINGRIKFYFKYSSYVNFLIYRKIKRKKEKNEE